MPSTEGEIGALGTRINETLEEVNALDEARQEAWRELITAKEELEDRDLLEEAFQHHAKLNATLSARVRDMSLLLDVHKRISESGLELVDLLNSIATLVGETLDFEEFATFLWSPGKDSLSLAAGYGFLPKNQPWYLESFLNGWYYDQPEAEEGGSILINDLLASKRMAVPEGDVPNYSLLCLPMTFQDRRVGLLLFSRRVPSTFSEDMVRLVALLAHQASLAIRNAWLLRKTVELSLTDELTDIFNRRHRRRRLDLEWSRTQRYGQPISVVMIDIDHFKTFNDTHGHQRGDEVLQMVAATLQDNIRKVDTVARYGGEEFLILLPGADAPQSRDVAETLRSVIEERVFVGEELQPGGRLTVSLGVATYPGDARNIKGLIGAADRALYQAKDGGRNRVCGYAGPELELDTIHEGRGTNASPPTIPPSSPALPGLVTPR